MKVESLPPLALMVFALFLATATITPSSADTVVACTDYADYVCPGQVCLGGPEPDPDCCSETVACRTGAYCDLGTGTCLIRTGQSCTTQGDCVGDTYCSTDSGLCVSRHFVFVAPGSLTVKVGSEPSLRLTVVDPANRTGTYVLSVSGNGKYFVKFFGTQDKVSLTLKPGEAATIPINFLAGSIGSYQLTVQVSDRVYWGDVGFSGNPSGIVGWSNPININVVSETKVPNVVTAPGPDQVRLFLLGIAAASLLLLLL